MMDGHALRTRQMRCAPPTSHTAPDARMHSPFGNLIFGIPESWSRARARVAAPCVSRGNLRFGFPERSSAQPLCCLCPVPVAGAITAVSISWTTTLAPSARQTVHELRVRRHGAAMARGHTFRDVRFAGRPPRIPPRIRIRAIDPSAAATDYWTSASGPIAAVSQTDQRGHRPKVEAVAAATRRLPRSAHQ
jgi:hypothetical protein